MNCFSGILLQSKGLTWTVLSNIWIFCRGFFSKIFKLLQGREDNELQQIDNDSARLNGCKERGGMLTSATFWKATHFSYPHSKRYSKTVKSLSHYPFQGEGKPHIHKDYIISGMAPLNLDTRTHLFFSQKVELRCCGLEITCSCFWRETYALKILNFSMGFHHHHVHELFVGGELCFILPQLTFASIHLSPHLLLIGHMCVENNVHSTEDRVAVILFPKTMSGSLVKLASMWTNITRTVPQTRTVYFSGTYGYTSWRE